MNIRIKWLVMLVVTCCVGRHASLAQKVPPLFSPVSSKHSQVVFTNKVKETETLHVFKYEYLYNGHGIGVADFNGDGLTDLFIAGNTEPNKLYLNEGDFTFKDVTAKAQVAGNGLWRTGVSIADVNGDGWPDIYVCHSGPYKEKELANMLYIHQGLQNGVPVFKEMAPQYGLDAPGTLSTQAAFFDYDGDGDLDMFLVNHSNHTVNPYLNTRKLRSTPNFEFGNRLFRNDKSPDGSIRFTDATLQAGIINNALNFGLSVSISDLNGDGWPDIYTTSDYTEQDYCYINQANGTFKQTLQQSFAHISRFSMGADIADMNNDGLPDVYTLDMLPEDNYRQKLLKGPDEYDAYHLLLDSGYYNQQMRNMLHLNQGADEKGTLRFSEIGQLAGISNTDWSWAPLLADLDNDGNKDLFITNGYLRDFTDNDFLKYTVADERLQEAAKGNFNFKTFDLVKKMPSNMLANYAFRNKGNQTFENVSESWGLNHLGISNAAAYADLDNDGDLDLIIGGNNEPVLIFKNNSVAQNGNHYLRVMLKGVAPNTFAIGSRVELYTNNGMQVQEVYPVRGYQSSVSTQLVFGLGKQLQIDSLRIIWPNGTFEVHTGIKANQLVEKTQQPNVPAFGFVQPQKKQFKDITAESGVSFRHIENDFIDFKGEVLMPYQLSRMGPALASADVNGDGLADFYVGGAIGQSGQLYLQQNNDGFIAASNQPWMADDACEDVNAMFFDVDKDGDMDLFVASGGNEYELESPEYTDRLYLNDGKGGFQKSAHVWPHAHQTPSCAVAATDIDNDGDTDLFIGGCAVPGSFPKSTPSFVLINETSNGVVAFKDGTNQWLGESKNTGMTTAATFANLFGDDKPALLVAGDWMPLRIFKNKGNKFEEQTTETGLKPHTGLWSALDVADVDGDGDLDIIAGNAGTNLPFKASPAAPVSLVVTDIDDNGLDDALFCYFIKGKSYPAASRDELLDQVVPLRKKFVKYKQYAEATLEDIVPENKLATAQKYFVTTLESSVFINQGVNGFERQALPVEAQYSRVYGIEWLQAGKNKQLLLTGNFFPWRVQWGCSDASLGVLLQQQPEGGWQKIPNRQTGLFIGGDVRKMAMVKNTAGQLQLVVAKNDDQIQLIKIVE